MADPYKRLDEDSLRDSAITPQTASAPPAGMLSQSPVFYVAAPNQTEIRPQKQKIMKILAVFQLVISISILMLTIICFIAAARTGMVPVDGSGIWGGIVAIIAGSFGVVATIRMKRRGRCLMITYLVMSIIACFCMAVILSMSAVWASFAKSYYSHRYHDTQNNNEITYGIYIILALMAFVHMVSTIVSLALICYNWSKNGGCCGSEDGGAPNVMYVPTTNMAHPQNQTQFVMVPLSSLQQHQQGTPVSQPQINPAVQMQAGPTGATGVALSPPAYYDVLQKNGYSVA